MWDVVSHVTATRTAVWELPSAKSGVVVFIYVDNVHNIMCIETLLADYSQLFETDALSMALSLSP